MPKWHVKNKSALGIIGGSAKHLAPPYKNYGRPFPDVRFSYSDNLILDRLITTSKRPFSQLLPSTLDYLMINVNKLIQRPLKIMFFCKLNRFLAKFFLYLLIS